MAVTKLENLINPQVMADMISAKIDKAIVVTPFAKIDDTLVGRPGDTITVPRYNYIGAAAIVAEGNDVTPTKMTVDDDDYTVVKAMKAVTLTDEAILSGYGNPQGEAVKQLAKSIADKIDADGITALLTSTNVYDGSAGVISYAGIVNAIDVFNEELNTEKVMFVNPKQVTTLRLDSDFISADKYPANVVMTGEIGMIANTHIVPSKRVVLDEVKDTYACPIVKLETDERTEDDVPALTIFRKRDINLEYERHTLNRTTDISVDEFYVAALTNEGKVVVATFASVNP